MPSSCAVRVTGARPSSPTPGWKAPTASAIPTSPETARVWPGSFASSPSPAASPVTAARRPRVDPRGRRARLLAEPRLRGSVRQPRPRRGLRRRRRRGRDGTGGHRMALEQVPRCPSRRRGPAHPAPERVQDRRPDGAGSDTRPPSCWRCSPATATARCWSRAVSTARAPWPSTDAWPSALDEVFAEIHEIQDAARSHGARARPTWPMLILRTPKGWTGPKVVDGLPDRGDVPGPPAPAGRGAHQSRAPGPARGVASQLPARGALRRRRASRSRPSATSPRSASGA